MPLGARRFTHWLISLPLLWSLIAAGACSCEGKPKGAQQDRSPAVVPLAPSQPPPRSSAFGGPAKLADLPAKADLGGAVFSTDGRHVAYVERAEAGVFVCVDGKRRGPYQDARRLGFQEGRSRFAYIIRRDEAERVVVDGEEGATFDAVGMVRFAPDGRVVYSAQRKGEWRVVAGSKEGPVAGASEPTPFVGKTGRRVAWVEEALPGGAKRLRSCSLEFTKCVAGAKFDAVLTTGADLRGVRLVYAVQRGEKKAVATANLDEEALGEVVGAWYEFVHAPAISEAGEHVAYLAGRSEKWVLVVDAKERPATPVGSLFGTVVARNGRALYVGMIDQQVFAFIDGEKVGAPQEEIDGPVLSADGAHYAYVAGRGGRNLLVLDGVEGPIFDKIVTPRFSPDGTRVVYRARNEGRRFAVIADSVAKKHRESPAHEAVFDIVFAPEGGIIGYGIGTKQELGWRVESL